MWADRSEVQEALLSLYLRLNGYFITSFIVHSSEFGKNEAQIDALAVRHPFNAEPQREVDTSPFLAHEDGVDKCFNPKVHRSSCSTRYDFTAWGGFLAPLVAYFKQRPPGDPGKVQDIYDSLQISPSS